MKGDNLIQIFYTVSNPSCNKYVSRWVHELYILPSSWLFSMKCKELHQSLVEIFYCTQKIGLQSRRPTFHHLCGEKLKFLAKKGNFFWKLTVRQPYVISENMRDAKRRENMELIHRECQINTICHLVIVCLAQVSASVPRDKNTNQTLGEMCTNNNVSKWKIWIPCIAVARIPPFFICLWFVLHSRCSLSIAQLDSAQASLAVKFLTHKIDKWLKLR